MKRNIQGRGALGARGPASGKILEVLEVEIRETGFHHHRVGSIEEVGMCEMIFLEGEMDQPNS